MEFPAYHDDKLIANHIYVPLSPGSSRYHADTIFSTSWVRNDELFNYHLQVEGLSSGW